MIISVICMVL